MISRTKTMFEKYLMKNEKDSLEDEKTVSEDEKII
jgi:hypothetical protein